VEEFGFFGVFTEIFLVVKKKIMYFGRNLPWNKKKILAAIEQNQKMVETEVLGSEEDRSKYRKFNVIPEHGLGEEEIYAELEEYRQMSKLNYDNGKISGTVYNSDERLTELLVKSMAKFPWANPLHPTVFRGVRKMESEIVSMVVDIYNGTEIGACGTTTSGGTESILMAVRTYREWAKAEKGITRPHMIIPTTAHAAFNKAANYFGIRLTHIPMDPITCKVNLKALKKAICSNTIMIVGSCPQFPHGIIDDIEALSVIALKYKIGLHVDCCLGSFIVPFMEKIGFKMPLFDFRLPGVTSISCDTHKYGFAPKGSSVIMYRTPDLRRYQYFSLPDWLGGVYISPSIAGSRPGNLLVGCWASLVYHGYDGYLASAKKIIEKTKIMVNAVQKHEDLFIFGNPLGSVFAFGSKQHNIYNVGGLLGEKGWDVGFIQYPSGLHISVTAMMREDLFEKDLDEAMSEVREKPELMTEEARLYGSAASIPDRSLVERLACGYIDALYTTL